MMPRIIKANAFPECSNFCPLSQLRSSHPVIVGSDIPAVRPRYIAQACAALGRHDVVFCFCLAADAGYWLIGALRRPRVPPGLLEHARWSTEHALACNLSALPEGAAVAFLE